METPKTPLTTSTAQPVPPQVVRQLVSPAPFVVPVKSEPSSKNSSNLKLMIAGILSLIIALGIAGYLYESRKTVKIPIEPMTPPPLETPLILPEDESAVPGSAPASEAGSSPSSDRIPPEETGENDTVLNRSCAVQGCHGMDITCGPVAPDLMCTMEYGMGDKCREFVLCEVVNGACQQTDSPKFTQCKTCAEQCQKITDPIAAFECESGC